MMATELVTMYARYLLLEPLWRLWHAPPTGKVAVSVAESVPAAWVTAGSGISPVHNSIFKYEICFLILGESDI